MLVKGNLVEHGRIHLKFSTGNVNKRTVMFQKAYSGVGERDARVWEEAGLTSWEVTTFV